MEIVAPDQLPDLPKGKDYGYQVIVRHDSGKEILKTYNGEKWCRTVESKDGLPVVAIIDERCFVDTTEYCFGGSHVGWRAVPAPESDDSGAPTDEDLINPAHYKRGPKIKVLQHGSWEPVERMLECIEVIRWITDGRLFNAMKYIWRVAFGGKAYQGMTLEKSMRKDIEKAQWYLTDWLDNPI